MLKFDDSEIFLQRLENFLTTEFALAWDYTWKDSDEVLTIQLNIPYLKEDNA